PQRAWSSISRENTGVFTGNAAPGPLGRLGLQRAAHDRRARAPSAREAPARPERARVHPHGPRRRLPIPAVSRFVQSVGTQLSLALLLVVAVALGIVYLTVVPSLRDR